MKKKLDLPFKHLTPKAWQNLALAATFAFYIAFLGFFLINTKMCETYRIDYCAFWSAGRIINERDFADIYNLELLSQYQKEIYHPENNTLTNFIPFEILYLPPFVLPFKFLSLFKLKPSFLIWIVINLTGFILYLRFFTKKITGERLTHRLGLMMMISLPVFINIYEGQVNFWLAICAGEFMRAYLSDKPYKAGLWLSGWWLKPQILILIIPFLLLKRSVKALTGFALSSMAIFGISFLMIKTKGFINLSKILMDSAEGGATSNLTGMTNWRMLGWHISSLTSEDLGTTIIIIGSLLTTCVTLAIFRKTVAENSTKLAIALLGIFAATGTVAWHAHVHMAVILTPPILYLSIKKRINKNYYFYWLLIPVLIQFLNYLSFTSLHLGIISNSVYSIMAFAKRLTGFSLNLAILVWAIIEYTQTNNVSFEEISDGKTVYDYK